MSHITPRTVFASLALGAAAITGVTLPASTAQAAPAPVSNLASTSCPAWIQAGQTSGCVTRLQQLLNTKEGAGLVVDGVFGANTTNAVKRWQSNHGLVSDGIVGEATKASLDPTSTTSTGNQKVVNAVHQVMAGTHYQYALGGGHATNPGPSYGSLNAAGTAHGTGLDCSGFARWTYSIAYGYDRLGAGTAASQSTRGIRTSNPQPGDLVFYTRNGDTHHVAVYMGNGQIAQEGNFGQTMGYSTVAANAFSNDVVTYEHFNS